MCMVNKEVNMRTNPSQAKKAHYGILGETLRIGVFGYPAGTEVKLEYYYTAFKGRPDQMNCWYATFGNGRKTHVYESQLRAIWFKE